MIVEIIKVVKISQNKVYIPKTIRERYALKDGEDIVWGINKNGEIVLTKTTSALDTYF